MLKQKLSGTKLRTVKCASNHICQKIVSGHGSEVQLRVVFQTSCIINVIQNTVEERSIAQVFKQRTAKMREVLNRGRNKV